MCWMEREKRVRRGDSGEIPRRTPEYVTRNDELLAGDARQSLMRNDSVKLDKRVVATPPNQRVKSESIWYTERNILHNLK